MKRNLSNTLFFPILLFLLFSFYSVQLSAQAAKNVTLKGQLSYSDELNDIWAYVDGNGHEYALVGVQTGVSIVDITTDPANPTELHFLPGARSIWRDLKTFSHYAYVTNETADGLRIIDLSGLPQQVISKDTIMEQIETAHNVWIDENGIMYLVGVNNSNGTGNYNGGMAMFDLNQDPARPTYLGAYTERYVHDVYVRDDIAYAGEIDDGLLTIIDVKNKANPRVLGSRSYANSFTHNTWLNDAGTVCFSTDELSDAYVYAWDVTDPTNIRELDAMRSSLSEGRATPHNVHVLNDFIVTSYYKDGLNIVDANRPTNIVEVGYYDTSPMVDGGTDGCWGAYPFLPSGSVLGTDIQEGLFVFEVNYERACYLEGNITDAANGQALVNVIVEATHPDLNENSDNMGDYASGTVDAGNYTVEYIKYGYLPESRNVTLSNGNITVQDVSLRNAPQVDVTYHVIDAETKQPIPDAFIQVIAPANAAQFDYRADAMGSASDPQLFFGRYSVVAGKWGYVTDDVVVDVDSMNNDITIELYQGYYDDYIVDYGWRVTGNATGGIWERGEPNGTDLFGNLANPEFDLDSDFGDQALVTGNAANVDFFEDDIDDGTTIAASPFMDLSTYDDPVLRYHWWMLNFSTQTFRGGDDTLYVFVNNNGVNREVAKYGDAWRTNWNEQDPIHLKDFFPTLGNRVSVSFVIGDLNDQNILEAAIDRFSVIDGLNNVSIDEEIQAPSQLVLYPNPVKDRLFIQYDLPANMQSGELTFDVVSLSGQSLVRMPLNIFEEQSQIEFPFASGVYFGVLRLNGKVIGMKKIVK